MVRAALLLLIVAGAARALPGAAPEVSIRFHERAEVDGPDIRLGEIARIIAGEERAVARLETLTVAKAAAFGLTRVLDTETLLARALQPFEGRYAFSADRKAVRVTTRSVLLAPDSLARLVDAFLAAQPRRDGEKWSWEIARAPREIRVPAAPHALEVSFAGKRRKGKVEMHLAIRGGAPNLRTLRTLPLTVNLRVEEPVLVARRAIAKDESLGPENAAIELRETTQMSDLAMAGPGRLLGRLAKVSIAPGRVVTPLMVAVPPAVRRGQEAKLVYRNGGVNITTGAVCRQDGVPGQIITAKSLATQRLVRVRVTEAGQLEPVPGG